MIQAQRIILLPPGKDAAGYRFLDVLLCKAYPHYLFNTHYKFISDNIAIGYGINIAIHNLLRPDIMVCLARACRIRADCS